MGLVTGRRMIVPGTLIDRRYRVVRELGRGGMGAVYLAEDVGLERRVAIKLARTELPWALARFRREAAALAAIRNEHVVLVHAYGEHQESPFFVMEFIDGEELASIVQMHQRAHAETPIHRAVEIIADVARGLAAVHAAGVLHGDIKAENIVIERGSGRAVLVDFGLAHDVERELGRRNRRDEPMLGTPQYLAPELYWVDDTQPTAQTDIYALAIVLYELLTGRVPFDAPEAFTVLEMHRDVAPAPPSTLRSALAPFDRLFESALAKDPAKRPPTAAAFAARLEAIGRMFTQGSDPDGEPTGARAASDTIRLLVIEDEPVFARLAKRCAQIAFAGSRAEVVTVGTGPEAVNEARRRLPHLVLLDYHLPELNGVEVLSRIRALPGGDETDVLVVSGEAGAAERWRFGILGVRDFLEKPVDLERFVAEIRAVAARHGWIRREIRTIPEERPFARD